MASEKPLKIKPASKKPKHSAFGAPSQHNQSSRKGKKAWRKNVDIGEVEESLEGLRQEERVTGTILQKIKDSDLFTVDLTGDEQIRNSMPRYSAAQLTSTKILAQRSAVPAVFSRTTTTTTSKRKHGLSREEKDRLMRIAKRPRKGPFNSVMDPSEYAAGSGTVALSAAVKNSGKYDPWVTQPVEEVKDGLETVQEKKVRPPVLSQTRDLINVPAIVEPHQGTSYNPPVDAHQELLLKAAAVEEKRLKKVEKMAAVKAKMDSALRESDGLNSLGAAGMTVTAQIDDGNAQEEEGEEGDSQGPSLPRKLANPKTKAQKNKAARILAEKRALIQRAERKRLLASISSVKQLRKSNIELLSIQEEEREQKKLALAEKLRKQGLAGQKLGKHKVPESELAVQLGEDLSESLRGLKPEGNLFRDRFHSLQQRALIEPRALVLPKKRRHKMVGYEKHAWKSLTEKRNVYSDCIMDVDRVEETQHGSSSTQPTKRQILPVDDAHPFDLESYISNYTGRTSIERLIHIMIHCPSIAPEAFQLCVQHIHQSRDPSLYQNLLGAYEQLTNNADLNLPNMMELAELDVKWADETSMKNQADRAKLEVELKTYTNNMIKESIRMAHRDLGDFFRAVGDYGTSLKHYTKSREFCTTSQHVLDMCMSILELLIEHRNYAHLNTYVFKADAALDAATAANTSGTAPPTGGAPATAATATKKKSAERDNVQSKLDLATALSHLASTSYEKAATSFLKIGPPKDLGDWIGKLVAPGDIAIYGTLCALATFQRSAIKSGILENSVFGSYIEQEPYMRELIEAYMSSNFKVVLELLSRYSTRHYIDVHLSPHVHDLMDLIRNCAVVLYFQPFATIKLDRMSTAFGWTIEEVEYHVVNLIQSGNIQGRVDSQNKILQAKKTDYRAELFARAIKAGREMQSANRKLLLRMRLQQAELIIKQPRGSVSQASVIDFFQGGE